MEPGSVDAFLDASSVDALLRQSRVPSARAKSASFASETQVNDLSLPWYFDTLSFFGDIHSTAVYRFFFGIVLFCTFTVNILLFFCL